MLIRLGRWLRAAGYDTAIAPGTMPDPTVLAWALREGRLLLTRDRALSGLRGAPATVVVLSSAGMEALAAEATALCGIDWLGRAFTRCLDCNGLLALAAPQEAGPAKAFAARAGEHAVRRCSACGKLYWNGGHVRRMRERLTRWQRGAFAVGRDPGD